MGLPVNRNGRIGLLSPQLANTDPDANGNGNLPGSGSNDPPGDGSTPSNPSNQEPGTGQSNTGRCRAMNQSGSGTPNASTGSTNTPNGSPAPAPVADSRCSPRAKKMTQPIRLRLQNRYAKHPHGALVCVD